MDSAQNDVTDKVTQAGQKASQWLGQSGQEMMEQARDWYDSAEDSVSQMANRSVSFAKQYPLQSVLIAAIVGFAVAILFRRSSSNI